MLNSAESPVGRADAGSASDTGFAVRISIIKRVLWTIVLLLLAAGTARFFFLRAFGRETAVENLRLIDLDGEMTIPAWYSSMMMLVCAGLLASHAGISRHELRTARPYAALAAIFLFMSLDEVTGIHEWAWLLIPAGFDFGGMFAFRWMIAVGPILLVGGLIFIPFLLRLPRRHALAIVGSGIVFVGGAYGAEFIGAYFWATRGESKAYFAAVFLEEGMEMAGLVLFISALLSQLARQAPRLTIALRQAPD